MSKKGRQNKVSQEVANPTVSKAEAEMAKDSIDTAKQAKKKSFVKKVKEAHHSPPSILLRRPCGSLLSLENRLQNKKTGKRLVRFPVKAISIVDS